MARLSLVALLLLAALVAIGCGRKINTDDSAPPALLGPPDQSRANLGFPEFATKNTTRVPGSGPTQIASAVLRAVYPDPARRPAAITLVDAGDWRVAVAAAALMAPPVNAPVLFTNGTDLPERDAQHARRRSRRRAPPPRATRRSSASATSPSRPG